jgi:uncharacterized protein YeaO (DUF488 family)
VLEPKLFHTMTLKQASVADVKNKSLKHNGGYVAITMRYYPRFLKKEYRDEFICALAPVKELLRDFNEAQRKVGHNEAFPAVDYESRFDLTADALLHLQRLAELSKKQDVFLVCICDVGQRCHREILMLAAQERFECEIGEVFHPYPTFMQRFAQMR